MLDEIRTKMATFRNRDGKWQARVCVNGVQKARTFPTKAKAKAWAAEVETKINSGEYQARSAHSFSETLTRYANEVSSKKRGERWELLRINAWQKLSFADYRLSDVTTPMLAEWRDERLKKVQNSTVNRELNLMSSIFEQARREWHWISHNPVRDVSRPAQPKHRDRLFTDDEITRICAALGYPSDTILLRQQIIAVAFLFAIETAMRREEITGLEWNRIDMRGRVATLPMTKNGDARKVPLSSEAIRLLSLMKKNDKPFDVDKDVLSSLFRRACTLAGVKDARFHDARHLACTRLAKKLNHLELARMIGHRDLRSLNVYFNETAEELAKKLD